MGQDEFAGLFKNESNNKFKIQGIDFSGIFFGNFCYI